MQDPVSAHAMEGPAAISAAGPDLGPLLEPALIHACGGRISKIHWFRTDWQRGGAATAFADYHHDGDGEPRHVVAKLPVGPRELEVLTALAEIPAPTPRVAAHGMALNGYDMGWIVMERLPGNPLGAHLHEDVFTHLAAAAAEFYRLMAERRPLAGTAPRRENWTALLERARNAVRANADMPHQQSWSSHLKDVHKVIHRLENEWESRPINTWCHGDLHPGNLMERREGSAWGPPGYILLDFAETHPGHWVEDAVYLERLFWGRPELLHGAKPVSLIAKARKRLGLCADEDYAHLANLRRVLMAATSPAFMEFEGHRKYLDGALAVLDRTLPLVLTGH
ncbi:MAG: aminoglycoside phosphotransferase family protein [Phycisphaerales bacterium]|nr:aminoglycoside phosphotransferase family protein [Phycisphaerales bacterium]